MKTSLALRSRLFLNTLAILGLGMGLAAVLAWRSVERVYLETQRENLSAQANLTAAALQGQPLPSGAVIQNDNPSQGGIPYTQTSNVQPGIHTRLLDQQGAVIYSLPVPDKALPAPPAEPAGSLSPQQLLARPEIAQALQGRSATSIRTVGNRRVLYAAAPVNSLDGGVDGLVYLTMPLPAAGLPGPLILELGGAGLAAMALALGAGTLLARRVTAPVEAIVRASAAVSAGDLSQHVETDSSIREIDTLAQAFNRMTASLRQADQAKNAFVADVTHELRTPLTVIKGTIETLEDGALDDVAGRGPLLASMQQETDRLIRLVNDLLVLTRADAGALNMEITPLDLSDLARARCVCLSGLAAQRGVCFEVTGLEPAWALGDSDRCSQVLDNLLDNAVRYSPPGSTVTIEVSGGAGEVRCTVHDRGPGIPEKHLPLLFDRFYRADASRNRQSGGAGLGLAIVRALVRAQGGRTGVESLPGQGASFFFSVPACPDCHPID